VELANSVLQDFFLIFFSSCARLIPRGRGYNQLSSQNRGGSQDDENRLIDNYDEHWDD
jgi:cation-dependent mannose-6-phosphate receptor